MSEERCRGCKVMGGRTITSDAEARDFTAAMRAHPEVWTRVEMGPVRVGESLDMEPCVDTVEHEKQYGRECPRVELWPENRTAAELVFATLPEHTRGLLPAFAEALVAEMGDEARGVVLRAFRTLQGAAVTGWLKAQYTPKDDA